MRIMLSASLFVAALAFGLGGCTPEAPKLTAPRNEQPATAPVAPLASPSGEAPMAGPVAPVALPPGKPPTSTPVARLAPSARNEQVSAPIREKLGSGQCRTCHRLQYDSWVKSGHARKALDCEGCHGNGSEYAKLGVMKDLARAKSLGLIFQTADFCAKCHPTADASYLPKAHAHKHKR